MPAGSVTLRRPHVRGFLVDRRRFRSGGAPSTSTVGAEGESVPSVFGSTAIDGSKGTVSHSLGEVPGGIRDSKGGLASAGNSYPGSSSSVTELASSQVE